MDEYIENFLKNKYQLNVTVREPQSRKSNTSTWTKPITGYLKLFPKDLSVLHPFERKLVQLTLLGSGRSYDHILNEALRVRRRVTSIGKQAAARVNKGGPESPTLMLMLSSSPRRTC